MTLSQRMVAHLRDLGAGHDDPAALEHWLLDLHQLAVASVPSCLGVCLRLQATMGTMPFVVLTPGPERRVHSSLTVRLPRPQTSPGGAVLVLWAAAHRAFVALAADVRQLLDIDPQRILLDHDLSLPPRGSEDESLATAMTEAATVDRALGFLLDRHGLPPLLGRMELARLAGISGTSLVVAALAVLAGGAGDVDHRQR